LVPSVLPFFAIESAPEIAGRSC